LQLAIKPAKPDKVVKLVHALLLAIKPDNICRVIMPLRLVIKPVPPAKVV